MDVDMQDNEWELCKENVRPLKSGRRMDVLQDALKNDNSSIRKFIQ